MTTWRLVAAALAMSASAAQADEIYSNEEEIYFAGEAGRPAPPWLGLRVREASGPLAFAAVDRFGAAAAATPGLFVTRTAPDRLSARWPDGRTSELRRARGFTCWMAIRKDGAPADATGEAAWEFRRGLRLHDQGGRARGGGGASGAPEAILRMRNVVWPPGNPNRPSLVLYVHRPDDPERAVSYSWADPAARLIGINLRWMQGSCTLDEERPS